MLRRMQYIRLLRIAAVLCAVLIPGIVRAQVSVTPTVMFDGTLYHYDYSVANLTAFDLAVVSIAVASQPDAVMNPTPPPGFLISFDAGVGLVSFLEDADPATTETFAAGTAVSGFRFDSVFPALPTTFEALDLAGNTFSGSTLGPVGPGGVVPEPGANALLAAFTLSGALWLRRPRRQTR
jgi:hypothetical protein